MKRFLTGFAAIAIVGCLLAGDASAAWRWFARFRSPDNHPSISSFSQGPKMAKQATPDEATKPAATNKSAARPQPSVSKSVLVRVTVRHQ